MNEAQLSGIMVLRNNAQIALFKGEIQGQLSDGFWENIRPHDHWVFWNRLEVVIGSIGHIQVNPAWEVPARCKYALERLIPYVGDRMIRIVRMSRAAPHAVKAASYMPDSFDEWCFTKVSLGFPKYSYMELVTNDIAKRYYAPGPASAYTERDLKHDIRVIKETMRSVND